MLLIHPFKAVLIVGLLTLITLASCGSKDYDAVCLPLDGTQAVVVFDIPDMFIVGDTIIVGKDTYRSRTWRWRNVSVVGHNDKRAVIKTPEESGHRAHKTK